MKRALLVATALLPIAACDSSSESEPGVEARNASVAEVADQVREAAGDESFIRAGKWGSQVTFEEMVAPGMPPEAAEQMRKMLGEGQRVESCLTEEQAQRPSEDFFPGGNNQCRYEHFTMRDGEIDARMRCSQGEIAQIMEMEGSYSPTAYQMRMTTSLEGAPAPASGMRMKMRVEAQRVGECEPKADSTPE